MKNTRSERRKNASCKIDKEKGLLAIHLFNDYAQLKQGKHIAKQMHDPKMEKHTGY